MRELYERKIRILGFIDVMHMLVLIIKKLKHKIFIKIFFSFFLETLVVSADRVVLETHEVSALPKTQSQILYQFLVVGDLINPIDCSWNGDLLDAYFHPDDVKTIRGIAISRTQRPDTYDWMFTEFGKYSVKSGFRTEALYPDRGPRMISYGPNIKPPLLFSYAP